jgi:hypothetical protein
VPGQRLPGINPGLAPRPNVGTAAPGYPRERLLNSNVANPNFGAPGYRRQNALNAPIGPNGALLYRPPVTSAAPSLQPTPPTPRQLNPQFRPAQRAQLGARPKPPAKCAGRPCRP